MIEDIILWFLGIVIIVLVFFLLYIIVMLVREEIQEGRKLEKKLKYDIKEYIKTNGMD